MRHLQKLLSTLIVADFARLTCSLEGSRLGPRNSTKWRETGRRWIGILATIYSSFLSSFHFSTFFSSREQKHCCSRACCFGVTLICILYCFPLPIILTEQTMAFTQSCHDFCLRSCNSVKRRRWGQRSAITATIFGVNVNHLPTVVALPIRSFMLANSIYLCFASANHQRLFLEL